MYFVIFCGVVMFDAGIPDFLISVRRPLAYLAFTALWGMLGGSTASADCALYPFTTFANNSTADATAVMNNFNFLRTCPNFSGPVGINSASPQAQLSILAPGASEQSTSALSPVFRTNAGTLNSTSGTDLNLGSFGFVSAATNSVALGIHALRSSAGSDWTTTAVGIGMDVDNTTRAGASLWLHGNGNVGIGTQTPAALLNIAGNRSVPSWGKTGLEFAVNGANLNDSTSAANATVAFRAGSSFGIPTLTATNTNVDVTEASTVYIAGAPAPGTNISIDNPHDLYLDSSDVAETVPLYLRNAAGMGKVSIGFGVTNSSAVGAKISGVRSGSTFALAISALNSGFKEVARFTGDGTGRLGIGTTTPGQALDVVGAIQLSTLASATSNALCYTGTPGTGPYVLASCSSSLRYKENVKSAGFGLKEIEEMRPVTFKWKGRDENDFGFIAEEMAKINPLFVTHKDGKIEGVKYPQLTAVLVGAVKELKAANDRQAEKLRTLEDENRKLRTASLFQHVSETEEIRTLEAKFSAFEKGQRIERKVARN